MAILETEVEIFLTGNIVKHFENLSYEIPRYKNKLGKMVIPKGTKIVVKIEDLPKSSNVKLTKICDDCKIQISNQTHNKIMRNRNNDGKDRCKKCGLIVAGSSRKDNPPYENSLEYYALNNAMEYLLTEFSDKNPKTPNNISRASADEYLWICPKYKHEYTMSPAKRTNRKSNCTYCSGQSILKGFNDLWTTHPHFAEWLKDEERGYEISAGSDKYEVFICEQCGREKSMAVNKVVSRGRISCSTCTDGVSYPEKFVFELLTQLNIDFETQKTFDWSKNVSHENPKLNGDKRYDFHIPFLKMIIEPHGEQHYKETRRSKSSLRSKTLKEEQENDKLKQTIAIENGIEIYVPLDCSESTMKHIKNSILSSCLASLFDLEHIDWLKCHETACHNLVKTACDLWQQGIKSTTKICKIMKMSRSTIINYLAQGNELGWCDYDAVGNKREIVQCNLKGKIIRNWTSMTEAADELGINMKLISACCTGLTQSAHGFIWMYKEKYEACTKNNMPILEVKYSGKKSIVQLDLKGNFINEYSSMKEAANEIGKDYFNISACCRGITKTAYGFKWMYKEDYEVLLE
ncbi:hypothetical protein QE429_003435 [Bacillus sp. SORGH_AS 510]|uniref:NUMOD1 domain-containing DNA-binding protein n=1 Tax=Bacillus sp. SORGH_AS_0510 TaxID=3041771 RepID=UPI0027803603|nr:zinc-ribbon domain-containing protein [Bacillus sp. SORGH_AS_0510]MDQ1146608.1 hypothetical protein [Bacillus sp. SORGH_AS_0510]